MAVETGAPPRTAGLARGPVRGSERALAPDLARGAMLLLIAVANSTGVFFANTPGVELAPHGLERVLHVLLFLFVHARAFPLFAIMFGYGLVQLARRQDAAGSPPGAVRALLVRRNAWLVAFGVVHGILLYAGDFLGGYGLVGIAFTLLLLRRSDRIYRVAMWYVGFVAIAVVVVAGVVIAGVVGGTGPASPVPTSDFPSAAADSYGAAVWARMGEWPVHTATLLPLILFVWIGAWAARRRVLEEPANHRVLLRTAAIVGCAVGAAGGLPMGLLAGGYLHVDATTAGWVKLLYEWSGLFGGIGYVALFGLIALRLSRPAAPSSGLVVTAVVALGRRSLSGYLFQSVAWLLLASPYLLALGERVDSPSFTAVGCAVAVWLTTVAGAYVMHRRGYRGPAEILLRRLTYGRRFATGG